MATENIATGDDMVAASGISLNNAPPCYNRSTMILTNKGECSVEKLAIGDMLRTASGAIRPIRWIGRRVYAADVAAADEDICPVLIRAGALADDVPARDLTVSPMHAMFIDGLLIPAKCLINGTSILQPQPLTDVEYFHVELETHDVILAEGAAAETYVNDENRSMFHNAAEYAALYPDAASGPAHYCAKRIEYGAPLDAIRARLAACARAIGLPLPATLVVHLADAPETRATIPPGVAEVHLISGWGRPAGEARTLGALLHYLSIDGMAIDLGDPCLARGFHVVEQHGPHQVRWTNGEGVLALTPSPLARVLEVGVGVQMGLVQAA